MPVYRVGYGSDPFAPPPWWVFRRRDQALDSGLDDQTSGGRFDDPAGRRGIAEARRYRIIYCASQREAAFGEAVAALRDQLTGTGRVSDDLVSIIQRNPQLLNSRAVIPVDWWSKRSVGATRLDGALRFLDLTHPDVLDPLWDSFAPLVTSLGFRRVDFGTLLGSSRRFTQEIAGYFYEQLDSNSDNSVFHGIYYASSLDLGWRCWAIFDNRFLHAVEAVTTLCSDDPDLVTVAGRYRLAIESNG